MTVLYEPALENVHAPDLPNLPGLQMHLLPQADSVVILPDVLDALYLHNHQEEAQDFVQQFRF